MSARTYVPHLRVVVKAAHWYISRWQDKLQQNLTTEQYTCVLSLLTALDECLGALGPAPINP